jgi:hypothetical protein
MSRARKDRRELSDRLDLLEAELEPRPPPPRVIFEIWDPPPLATGGPPIAAGEAFERAPDRSIRAVKSAYRLGERGSIPPRERHFTQESSDG